MSVGNGDGQLEGHRGVVSWVVTGVWTVVLVNGGMVSWVITG